MQGAAHLFLLAITIGFIIFSGSYLRWHPLLSLFVATLGFGLISQLHPMQLIAAVTSGFGSIMGSAGLIIVLGSVLGIILEETGCIYHLGNAIQNQFRANPSLGIAFLGMILGIPVFCDAGFIVLVSLAKSVSIASKIPLPAMTLSLSGGLYTTHTLVPPTPGPVAAAANMGASSSLGLIILLGMVVSVPVVIVAFIYANRIARTLEVMVVPEKQELMHHTPSLFKSLLLIGMPVLLIATASIIDLFYDVSNTFTAVIGFTGSPIMALMLTVSLGLIFFRSQSKSTYWIEKGIRQAGPILVLTGFGGALGAVIKASPVSLFISNWAGEQALTGETFLIVGFLVSALFKTAQGSSTSAIVITSALMAPLTMKAGFNEPIELALLVLAIGSGSMTVSHANDSYFWVVSQFSGFDLRSAFKGITVMSLLQGLAGLVMVLILYTILR